MRKLCRHLEICHFYRVINLNAQSPVIQCEGWIGQAEALFLLSQVVSSRLAPPAVVTTAPTIPISIPVASVPVPVPASLLMLFPFRTCCAGRWKDRQNGILRAIPVYWMQLSSK